jgi:ectoine hydroxylase-related dioxygenase (phytanoyl-CoA dioxygenase family)
VSVAGKTVETIDGLLHRITMVHAAAGNRSEFVRVAIEKELAHWSSLNESPDTDN